MHFVTNLGLSPYPTIEQTGSDTAQALPAGAIATGNVKMQHCVLVVKDAAIRFALGATPVSSGLGAISDVGDVIELDSYAQINQFKWINSAAGVTGKLVIYPEG